MRHSNEKKSHKITIVQSASRQELENDTSLVKSEKVVVGILEIKIVTESDVRWGGGSAKVTKSDERWGAGELKPRIFEKRNL